MLVLGPGIRTGLRSDSGTRLAAIDRLLLLAFLAVAVLGTATRCLMVNDGAVFVAAQWLGDAWDLYLRQVASRGLSVLVTFGPAWAARSLLGLSSGTFMVVAHALYFAVPLAFWGLIRAVEPHPAFARLYLAISMVLVYFPSELIVGVGLWVTWAAILASPGRRASHAALATLGLGTAMIFTHPATILMTVLYTIVGAALSFSGRPFPPRTWLLAAAVVVLLTVGYLATSTLLPSTNPTIVRALSENSSSYIDPWWMLATIGRSPMLAALWLLLLAPGANALGLRWRVTPVAMLAIAGVGLWFAVNGITQVTWITTRHTAVHVLALALALAVTAPAAAWTAQASRALGLYAAIVVASALSYSVDMTLLEGYVEHRLAPGYVDAEALRDPPWPPRQPATLGRVAFKWSAGADYVRDVVVPDYDWYLLTLAFQSYFLSDRTAVLFHRISEAGWVPFECPPVRRALAQPHDARDAAFLRFILDTGYCVDVH
jgi:hypothetical protein